MTGLSNLYLRNNKLFFKDKGMFFTSLITPMILLVLYATFLGNVFRDSFASAIPDGFIVDSSIIDGIVGGQLLSSLLAVSPVTVAFCSNLLMVQDKVSGARRDLDVSPVSPRTLALGYFLSSATVTLIISYSAMALGFIYLCFVGWYLSVGDILLIALDVLLLVLFGTGLSSLINCKLSTNGQASAVGTIISSVYGFICGAYMPISSFSEGLRRVLAFLPGTYGTSLLRNHCMSGALSEMSKIGTPDEIIDGIRDSVDANFYFFESSVPTSVMFCILGGTVVLLIGAYVLVTMITKKRK